MKETLKNIPVLGRKLVGIYSWYLRLKDRKFLKKNLELKDTALGKKCFIIATGPSIKTQDLKPLAGYLSISVSNFFVHPDFKIIKPEYHVFAPSHPPITDEQYGAMLKDSDNHFPHGQKILLSITDKHIVEKFELFKNQNIFYYFLSRKPLSQKETINFSEALPSIQTSPHIAMYLAFFLGTAEINLLGCDHDWILHLGETRHFYDEKNSVLAQAGYNEWTQTDLGTECEAYGRLWAIYRRMRLYSSTHGIKIINTTAGGLLDLFPRKSLEDAVKRN